MIKQIQSIRPRRDPQTQTGKDPVPQNQDGEKDLILHAAIGLYILQKGRFRYVNDKFAGILGYAPDALIGKSLWDLVHPDDRSRVKLVAAPPRKSPADVLTGFRMIHKMGGPIWVHMEGSTLHYQGGPAQAGFMMDYTAREHCILSLRESLERYETILNDVDVQLGEMDLQGNLTFINDAGCRIWGLQREELLGLNYQTYMDQETAQRFSRMYEEVFLTGVPVKNVVLDIEDSNGMLRTIEKSVSLMRTEGKITGFRMVTRDITERRQAENKLSEHRSRLEAIFSSVKDAIITVDHEMKVIECNKSTETICGISMKDLARKSFAQFPALCRRACHEILAQTLDNKAAISEHLIECDHQSRPHQVVSVSSTPLRDARGSFLGAVLVIRDLTLIKDLERELRERRKFQSLVGASRTMQEIYNLLENLADLDTTVLITGESGTGKELVARALHYSGNRSNKAFVTVNCSALAENLLESELFGHIKGAFTGAVKNKMGRFQAADGGTLLLDEIGDVSPRIQMKLLRVLQEKEFERVGDSTPQKVDVRVIACTNKDLKEKVKYGEFRHDLYYRLKVVEVGLPPLRDRLEDVPLLVEHFRCAFNQRFHKNIEGISNEVLANFMSYAWPGNVRELEHVMEHAFVLCPGGAITLNHLPADIRNREWSANHHPKAIPRPSLSAQEIRDALRRTGWNKAKAARLLKIGRRTIYRKIEAYRITEEETA